MSAPAVVMYTTGWCPYCARSRKLLTAQGTARGTSLIAGHAERPLKNITIDRLRVRMLAENKPDKRAEMQSRSGRTTVPQIFIGDQHVGGCDDLYALEDAGKLDRLLNN